MKPGYKTTEFWLTLLFVALNAIQPYFEASTPEAKALAMGISALSIMGYSASRGLAKKGNSNEMDVITGIDHNTGRAISTRN